MRKLIVAGLLVTIALGVLGVYVLTRFYDTTPGLHESLELIPQDAMFYGHISLDPSNAQKKALRGVLSRFPGRYTFEEGRDELGGLLDTVLTEFGLSFDDDVEPWLGDEIAVFGNGPSTPDEPERFAFLLATQDEGAARRAIESALGETDSGAAIAESHLNVDYRLYPQPSGDPIAYGFLDGFLIVGSESGLLDAIEASTGDPLSTNEDYRALAAPLDEDHLALFYTDLSQGLRSLPIDEDTGRLIDALGLPEGTGRNLFSVRVQGRGFLLEATSIARGEIMQSLSEAFTGEGLVADLPSDAWFAMGVGDLEELGEALLQIISFSPDNEIEGRFTELTGLDLRSDVLAWMDAGGAFVTGDGPLTLGGGVVVASNDPEGTVAAVEVAAERVEAQLPGSTSSLQAGGLEGFEWRGLGAPITVLGGERLVAAFGGIAARGALSPRETLEESELFGRAMDTLGEGREPVLFVNLDRVEKLVDSFLPSEQRGSYERWVEPILGPLTYALAGSEQLEEVMFQQIVVGVE